MILLGGFLCLEGLLGVSTTSCPWPSSGGDTLSVLFALYWTVLYSGGDIRFTSTVSFTFGLCGGVSVSWMFSRSFTFVESEITQQSLEFRKNLTTGIFYQSDDINWTIMYIYVLIKRTEAGMTSGTFLPSKIVRVMSCYKFSYSNHIRKTYCSLLVKNLQMHINKQ